MPLKPNVMEDIARDHSIPAPPPRAKFHSDEDTIMLEDESGRICLVGDRIRTAGLVTGVILGALGIETNSGDFEVVDYCFAGMAPQETTWTSAASGSDDMEVDTESSSSSQDEWVALVSGLEVGALSPADAPIELLVEFLTGELGGQQDQASSSRISRIIIAGNSLAPAVSASAATEEVDRKPRKYGQDHATFTPHPTLNLSGHLLDIARSMPIHILPGPTDPSGTILPQQSLPRAMFGGAASYSTFICETNPTYIQLGPATGSATTSAKASASKTSASASDAPKRTILVNSGQPIDDIFKYLPSPPHDRLSMAESTLHWRHTAPTAPDTLWCHPYFTTDPFVMTHTPHLYAIGNQPKFATRVATERAKDGKTGGTEKKCRIVLIPNFRESGTVVLVNMRTLDVKTVSFVLQGMTGDAKT
ncbi:hypothetical protein EUX98_g321 [Antrodiella citrinella]|uniref:DNA polymerase alpha/delta/epsilon subunit B domain-containing protein n=1 Tax=Antrodiella citrinella TaxID=2447956 RepID=A0A4S4N4C1_9APHY|nr:hypothetical protein EUX98_g321 [Antrodiella citrinella]